MATLRVDTRQLSGGGVEVAASVAADDPLFEGLDVVLGGPVDVAGLLRASERETYLWQAHLRAVVIGECRRCLGRVEQEIDEEMTVVFSSDPELLEDPSVYPLPPDPSIVDVSTAVREELVLRTPGFPLCGEGCKGLCPGCGADLNAGPCGCAAPGMTS